MKPPLIPQSRSTCPESQRMDSSRSRIAPLRRRKLAISTALLIGVLVWFFWPAKPDLAGFDPNELGRLEAAMWRDYYQQDWMALSGHAWQVARRQYKFSRWDSLRLAWHSVQAARAFRQDTLNESAVADMTDYYRIVAQDAPPTFAPDQAARLEVQWWRQRRADAPPADWGRTIAQLTSAIYGCSAEEVLPAAQARVAAMVYRDARRTTGLREDEWGEVSRQLANAYALLKRTIENVPRTRARFPGANPACSALISRWLIMDSSPAASTSMSGLSVACYRLQPRPSLSPRSVNFLPEAGAPC